jgi:hypothetical protein
MEQPDRRVEQTIGLEEACCDNGGGLAGGQRWSTSRALRRIGLERAGGRAVCVHRRRVEQRLQDHCAAGGKSLLGHMAVFGANRGALSRKLLLVVVEGELSEFHESYGVGLANRMHVQVVHHAGGVVEADDIRESYECFLRVAGIAGGKVLHQPQPLAAQPGGVVAETVNLWLRAGLFGHRRGLPVLHVLSRLRRSMNTKSSKQRSAVSVIDYACPD